MLAFSDGKGVAPITCLPRERKKLGWVGDCARHPCGVMLSFSEALRGGGQRWGGGGAGYVRIYELPFDPTTPWDGNPENLVQARGGS